ncbi:MAG: prolipoprotein diacylglyceryl transferase [Anaerolineaceae bacterium]
MIVREGFSIGPVFIYWYAILIMIGALAATFLASYLAKQRGENPETPWDMLPWLLIGGIIGARLWHIFTPPASMVEQGFTTGYYLTHPLDALNIRNGGLGIPGAVMGGVFALWLYCKNKRMKMLFWMDLIAPGLALAQAVGRWGNFLNQEVYGAPSNLPWAITIDVAHRLPGFENYATYHPLFLYESLWNLFIMGLLLYLGMTLKDRLINGDIFRFYLFLYPFARFLLEFLRLDPSPVAGLNVNQTLMGVLMVASIIWYIWAHRQKKDVVNIQVNPEGEKSEEKDAPEESLAEKATEEEVPENKELAENKPTE